METARTHGGHATEDDLLQALLVAALRMHGVSADHDGLKALLVHARRNRDAHLSLQSLPLPERIEPAAIVAVEA